MYKQENKKRVLLVDDVLATGNTFDAAEKLCRDANLEVIAKAALINLCYLNNKTDIPTLIQFEE
jgi:adenine/guanine phosphoribosyltransferase-like PRPP-binding protein